VGDVHPDVAESLRNLGSILREKGDLDAAERVSREALVILQKVYGNEHVFVADQMLRLGEVAIRKGDDHAAEPLLEEALRICQKVVPDGGRLTAALLCSRALLLVRTNRPGESEAAARECLAMIRRSVPEESHRIPEAESILGACLSALQRYEEAEPLLLKSYHTLVDQAARTSPSSARIEWLQKLVLEGLQRIVTLYDSWDAAEPGKGYAEKAAAWRAKLEEASKSQNAN
jgi:tetratricopeptide (TPR) repeat protein